MKNRFNFSSHSGNIRVIDPCMEQKPMNYQINQNNYNKNTICQIERNRSSKTPEKNIKRNKNSEKKQINKKDFKDNKTNEVDFSPQMANDLIFNINDDFQTLIYKNSKLREFIVKANETIFKLVLIFITN